MTTVALQLAAVRPAAVNWDTYWAYIGALVAGLALLWLLVRSAVKTLGVKISGRIDTLRAEMATDRAAVNGRIDEIKAHLGGKIDTAQAVAEVRADTVTQRVNALAASVDTQRRDLYGIVSDLRDTARRLARTQEIISGTYQPEEPEEPPGGSR